MTFFGFVGGNVRSRPLRAILTAGAVAIAVMAVLAVSHDARLDQRAHRLTPFVGGTVERAQ